ncbi:MAG: hypothetical protein IJE51_07075 [Clostridia bacterium]|nr:hypothetical protein [Clostridia bacterium]
MIPYKNGPKKKLPNRKGTGTVFSTSDKKKNKVNFTEFGEEFFYSHEDPNGMYTGIPTDKNEVPTQDADDL